MIEVQRLEGARGTAIREGRRIVWLFSPPTGHVGRPRTRTIAREAFADPPSGELDALTRF